MTEQEKMIGGALYDAGDPELVRARQAAGALCYEINRMHPAQVEERHVLLRRLLGGLGEGSYLETPFRCDYGYNISAGRFFYVNYNCVMLDCAPITFGDHVFVAPNCAFYTAGHPLVRAERNSGLEFARPIRVGDDVWIGGNTVVNPGVCIGDGVVIGSGSVVTRDIPAGVVAVGNPCRVLRPITRQDRMFRDGTLLEDRF